MTKFVKKNEINNEWYEIDASNAVVGRLASIIAKILRGKNKNQINLPIETNINLNNPFFIYLIAKHFLFLYSSN